MNRGCFCSLTILSHCWGQLYRLKSKAGPLSVEEIDEVVDRLNVAADTLQLLITDIDGNDALADVTVHLNTTVNKVRRLCNI